MGSGAVQAPQGLGVWPLPPPPPPTPPILSGQGSACGILTFPGTGCSCNWGQGKEGTWVRRMETFPLDWSLGPRVPVGMGGGEVCHVYGEGREGVEEVPNVREHFGLPLGLGKGRIE